MRHPTGYDVIKSTEEDRYCPGCGKTNKQRVEVRQANSLMFNAGRNYTVYVCSACGNDHASGLLPAAAKMRVLMGL